MAGNINAAGIIVVVLLTVFLMLRFGRKPNKLMHILGGILGAIGIALLAILTSTHMCKAGQPFLQWFIPCACLGCILIELLHNSAPRRNITIY